VQGTRGDWLLGCLTGDFTLLTFGAVVPAEDAQRLARAPIPCAIVQVGGVAAGHALHVVDAAGLVARRYDARDGTCYLFRPDQHVCARWRRFDVDGVLAAIARATANA
jgi:3-(3-hydroxy-phenyl)propionate hydroxylase